MPEFATSGSWRISGEHARGVSAASRDVKGVAHRGKLTLDDVMTAQQVAALLLMRQSTVEDYARRGMLPSIKLGRHRRFVRADVVAAIEELRQGRRVERSQVAAPRSALPTTRHNPSG